MHEFIIFFFDQAQFQNFIHNKWCPGQPTGLIWNFEQCEIQYFKYFNPAIHSVTISVIPDDFSLKNIKTMVLTYRVTLFLNLTMVVSLSRYDYFFTRYRAWATRSGCAIEQIEFFGLETAGLTQNWPNFPEFLLSRCICSFS